MALARAKVEAEGRCRLGPQGCDGPLEAAHVVERRYDDVPTVPPSDVIPLCRHHHGRYDARRVSVLEILTLEEQAAAVDKLGIVRALRRTTSGTSDVVERPA
jgi:hypothetical protein